jgi:hypothetical protein
MSPIGYEALPREMQGWDVVESLRISESTVMFGLN